MSTLYIEVNVLQHVLYEVLNNYHPFVCVLVLKNGVE